MLSTETLFTLHDRRTRDKRQVSTHFVEATLAWPWLWGLWERQFSGAFHNSKKKWRRSSLRTCRFLALWEVNPYSSVGHYEGWKTCLNFTSNLLQFKYRIWRFRKWIIFHDTPRRKWLWIPGCCFSSPWKGNLLLNSLHMHCLETEVIWFSKIYTTTFFFFEKNLLKVWMFYRFHPRVHRIRKPEGGREVICGLSSSHFKS